MTDRPTTDRTPGDDAERDAALRAEREIAALRAELRAGGLLPGLPAAHEPTEESADAMLRRVLASRVPLVDDPLAALAAAATADDEVARARERLTARQAADARRRRATVTRTLFGLAATAAVGAVVVLPMMARPEADSAAEAGATPEEAAYQPIQPMGEGLDDGGLAPRGPADLPTQADLAPLVGVVVDQDGCLAVLQDETGTVFIPVDAAGATVREELRAGERVSVQPAPETDLLGETTPPPGCDPAGPFWPASSLTVLQP